MMRETLKQKVILLLVAGVALGLSRSPKNYFKILEGIAKEWKEIEHKRLFKLVREFYNDRIVDYKEKDDGTVYVVLTKEGKKKVLEYKLDELEIKKPDKWDKKWRVVIFDIPEKKKKAREALRDEIKKLGLRELQKSVFIYPYPCENEIDFVVEIFDLRPYVRFLLVDSFTNEEQWRLKFNLY